MFEVDVIIINNELFIVLMVKVCECFGLRGVGV